MHVKVRKGFTLVELLVVIGIIALLISILLPALSGARKQANTVKCLASLREMGNAYMFYVNDSKGWAPPLRARGGYKILYDKFNPPIETALANQYWYCFLAKYVTRTAQGQIVTGNTGADRQEAQRHNIIWGCPEWQPYINASFTGGTNPNDPGYGWNGFPEYTATYPAPGQMLGEFGMNGEIDDHAVSTVDPPYNNSPTGRWYRANKYTNATERALISDAPWYFIDSTAGAEPIPGQHVSTDQAVWVTGDNNRAETQIDCYRHGKLPPLAVSGNTGYYSPTGGKVAYNVLFADGHAATLSDRESAFRVTRMRFPG